MFDIHIYAAAPILVALAYLVLRPLWLYWRDPLGLRNYPAPSLLAAISPLWLIGVTWSQNRSRVIHEHLNKLGPVMRVGPNNLIFNDPAAIKDIYGVLATSRGVIKDEIYDRMAGDAHDLVQLRDREEHSGRRKAIANAFAAKTVVNMESVIRKAFGQLIKNLDSHVLGPAAEGAPVNLRRWLNYFTLDVISDMGFGQHMGFSEARADQTNAQTVSGKTYFVPDMIDGLHRGVRYGLTMANVPSRQLTQLSGAIIARIPRAATCLGYTDAIDFENICVDKLRRRIRTGPPSRSSGDFMDFILSDKRRSSESSDGQEFGTEQFQSLVADSMMMMNAGSNTTAAALTSTIWFLLKNPVALERLRKEVTSACADLLTSITDSGEESILPYEAVKDLPFLRACIDESLRLRPPIAYQLPRAVSQPTKIAGYDIAPGTVVAVDFDEDFPRQREDLKAYNIVFSQGSRAYIGRHLALVELQILISTLLTRYNLKLAEESVERLEVFERFNSNPGSMLRPSLAMPHTLVTGANSFVAAYIIVELITEGHTVTSVVRRSSAGDKLLADYPEWNGNFDFQVVEDYSRKGAFDAIFQARKYDHIVHTAAPMPKASALDFDEDFLRPGVDGTLGLLDSAKTYSPTVKSLAITGSANSVAGTIFSIMARLPEENKVNEYTNDMWNDIIPNSARESQSPYIMYCSSKKETELAVWEWMRTKNPNFSVTVLLPALILGPPPTLAPLNLSVSFVYRFFNGTFLELPDTYTAGLLPSYVDVRDLATTHVRALSSVDAVNKRFLVGAPVLSSSLILDSLNSFAKKNRVPELEARLPKDAGKDNQSNLSLPRFNVDEGNELLGLNLRSAEETFGDVARKLIDLEKE
ncbi:hypothetical protein KC349_g8972 [Hortaea werneckii]|nr:hypothetical protein KC349_g8972 [Hortaea werneckii]